MDIKILVATHKAYWMPEDNVYLPLHVGREGKQDLGFVGDNTGDNISLKNPNFCELTGLYWAWQNLKCDVIGLCHYRRYFSHPIINVDEENKRKVILNKEDYNRILMKYDVIVPWMHNLKTMTVKEHYCAAHHEKDLLETRAILEEKYPEYLKSFDQVMNQKKFYLFNMFVMKKELFDSYASWLFDILFGLERRIDISSYDNYQQRVYGFLSERLFNVWLCKNADLRVKQVPVVFLEEETTSDNLLKKWIKYVWFSFYERFK